MFDLIGCNINFFTDFDNVLHCEITGASTFKKISFIGRKNIISCKKSKFKMKEFRKIADFIIENGTEANRTYYSSKIDLNNLVELFQVNKTKLSSSIDFDRKINVDFSNCFYVVGVDENNLTHSIVYAENDVKFHAHFDDAEDFNLLVGNGFISPQKAKKDMIDMVSEYDEKFTDQDLGQILIDGVNLKIKFSKPVDTINDLSFITHV